MEQVVRYTPVQFVVRAGYYLWKHRWHTLGWLLVFFTTVMSFTAFRAFASSAPLVWWRFAIGVGLILCGIIYLSYGTRNLSGSARTFATALRWFHWIAFVFGLCLILFYYTVR